MKALTICQPYAHLIMTGAKLVENRTWPTDHRGLLLIHAGKSREWLEGSGHDGASLAFGALVGCAVLLDCVHINDRKAHTKYPWLHVHEHARGPWCWILARNPSVFTSPVPYRGQQGLFDVPHTVFDYLPIGEVPA